METIVSKLNKKGLGAGHANPQHETAGEDAQDEQQSQIAMAVCTLRTASCPAYVRCP